jgi:hypothetical protein
MNSNFSEFLGANVLDNKPFIVTPIMDNGNARLYIQNHPDCDRLEIVSSKLMVQIQVSEFGWSAVSRIPRCGVSSLTECCAW